MGSMRAMGRTLRMRRGKSLGGGVRQGWGSEGGMWEGGASCCHCAVSDPDPERTRMHTCSAPPPHTHTHTNTLHLLNMLLLLLLFLLLLVFSCCAPSPPAAGRKWHVADPNFIGYTYKNWEAVHSGGEVSTWAGLVGGCAGGCLSVCVVRW